MTTTLSLTPLTLVIRDKDDFPFISFDESCVCEGFPKKQSIGLLLFSQQYGMPSDCLYITQVQKVDLRSVELVHH